MSIAIRAEHVSKEYRLGVINHGMLYKDFQSWMARRLGRPDPHGKIGEDHFQTTDDTFWALKDVSFDIQEGDRVGIVGKNGAGKSTLLKIFSRITAPTEGKIKIKGRVASLLEVGTGFNGELTGRENIYLNGAILGMKKREIDRKIDEIIDFSGIENHIDTPVKRYSSGMYVRLAFAVAANLDSEILLADEVLAVGDASFQKKAIGKMNDLSSGQGRTILFVSHNMSFMRNLCSKGLLFSEGRLILDDSLDSCLAKYLGMDIKTEESGLWGGDIGDENIRIKNAAIVSLADSNSSVNRYNKGDSALLKIDYEVLKENANYVFCAEFVDMQGNVICASSATEYFSQSLPSINSVGMHSMELQIDTGIFAQGKYLIKFDFAIRNTKRIIQDNPSLAFHVDDKDTPGFIPIPKRLNAIAPNWAWSLR